MDPWEFSFWSHRHLCYQLFIRTLRLGVVCLYSFTCQQSLRRLQRPCRPSLSLSFQSTPTRYIHNLIEISAQKSWRNELLLSYCQPVVVRSLHEVLLLSQQQQASESHCRRLSTSLSFPQCLPEAQADLPRARSLRQCKLPKVGYTSPRLLTACSKDR